MSNTVNLGANQCPAAPAPPCGPFRLDLGEGTYTEEILYQILNDHANFQYGDKSPFVLNNSEITNYNVEVQHNWADGLEVYNQTDDVFAPLLINNPNLDASISINGQPAHDLNSGGSVTDCEDGFDELVVGPDSYVTISGTICKKAADTVPLAPDAAVGAGALVLPWEVNMSDGSLGYVVELTTYPAPDAGVATVTLDDPATGAVTIVGVAAGTTEFGYTVTDVATGYVSNCGIVTVTIP